MKLLHLTLKKKWFDMIDSGEKTEEYREVKPYWMTRLINKSFDAVLFKNGYGDVPSMLFEFDSTQIGYGKPKWGAPEDKPVFIIKFHRRLPIEPTKETK